MRSLAWLAVLASTSVAYAQPPSSLSVERALARAIEVNPSVRASESSARAAGANARAIEAARLAVFTASFTGQHNERFSGTSRGIVPNSDSSVLGGVGLRYTTELGTQIEISTQAGPSWRSVNLTPGTVDTVTIGPIYTAQATVDARQPLLRGAGDDAMLSSQRQAEAQQRAAEQDRDQAISQLMLDVLSAYWELWYAQEQVRVQREALALAERQHEEQRLRVEQLGTAAPADLLQLASQRASIRESLAIAERDRHQRAVALGRFLAIGPEEASALVASSTPPEEATAPALAALLDRATERSSELRSLAEQIEAARERVRGAADADQPRLDVVGRLAVIGVWDENTIQTLELPGGRPAFGGLLGLELELPLGTSQQSEEHAAARAELEAAEARYEDRAQALAAQIGSLHAQVETSAERIALSEESARIARELATAEERRIGLGTSTPLALVQAQQSARESELRRLRAIVDRTNAGLELNHRAGQLLVRAQGSRR